MLLTASLKRPICQPKKHGSAKFDVKENEPAVKRHKIENPSQERDHAYNNDDVRQEHYMRLTLEKVVNFSTLHGIQVTARHFKIPKSTIVKWSK